PSSLLIPGLFGYRMDTPGGGNYWGAIGRDPAWDRYFAGGKLREGVVLRITFPGAGSLDTTQQVRGDGKLALPSLGEVRAAGRTPAELAEEITKLYPQIPSKQAEVALVPPGGFLRYSGGGPYPGVLVVLVALWSALQAFRKADSVFTLGQRKHLWFWTGV